MKLTDTTHAHDADLVIDILGSAASALMRAAEEDRWRDGKGELARRSKAMLALENALALAGNHRGVYGVPLKEGGYISIASDPSVAEGRQQTADKLIDDTGDVIIKLIEQCGLANWIDDHGHDVKMNTAMIQLSEILRRVVEHQMTYSSEGRAK